MAETRLLAFIVIQLLILYVRHTSQDAEYPGLDALKKEFPAGYSHKVNTLLAGTFIASHKYFGADLRYQVGAIRPADQVFYKRFPSPPLKELHPDVLKACEQGADPCMDLVIEKAKLSGSMATIVDVERKQIYEPFESYFEAFLFRQSAMYYLCWYAKRKVGEVIKYSNGPKCLSQLRNSSDLSFQRRQELYDTNEDAIRDVRQQYMERDPYQCANTWFCPDPCYGHTTGGNYDGYPNDPDKHLDNPCKGLKNPQCYIRSEINSNLEGMLMNKMNFSCDCLTQHNGFVWDLEFRICVDIDECELGKECWRGKKCQNTVGGYKCICPKGFVENWLSENCDRIPVFRSAVHGAKQEMTADEAEEDDLVSDLLQFVGVSAACHSTIHVIFAITYSSLMLVANLNPDR